MHHKDFASAYNPKTAPYSVSERFDTLMQEPRQWSMTLGKAAHAFISQETLIPEQLMQDYSDWDMTIFARMNRIIPAVKGSPEEEAAAYTELHFHELNFAMQEMWRPMVTTEAWNPDRRRSAINNAQGLLGVMGVQRSLARRSIIDRWGTEELFGQTTPDHAPFRSFVGTMQEIDAGIVLLEVMRRHKNLTVIPAPQQFRRGKEKGLNVTFLVLDTATDQAVGVRMRPRVFASHAQEADKDRVVLIDGMTDFGNIKSVRIQKGSSKERSVPWPGTIAAKQACRIKVHGRGKIQGAAKTPQQTMLYKIEARTLAGSTRVDLNDLSNKVGERILAKLQP